MKGNRWLVIENGRLARGPFEDARAREEREALAAAWDTAVGRASPSDRPSKGGDLQADSGIPFMDDDGSTGVSVPVPPRKRPGARVAPARSDPHSLLCPSSGEPVYPQDAAGFEAGTGFDGEAEFSDASEARDRPFRPARRGSDVSLWRDGDAFACCATADREREVTRLVSRTQRSGVLDLPSAPTIPTAPLRPARAPGKAVPAWAYVLAALAVFALVLLSKGLGGRLRGSLGYVTEPDETNALVGDRSRFSVEGTTLSALAPEPLRAFEEVVRAKLERDPAGYAKALLRLDASRHAFPPQSLPTRAFIAAMSMHSMSDEELDPNPRWRAFLEKLGAERAQGIGVVGYEQSRVRKAFVRLLADAQKRGVRNAGPRGLAAFWGAAAGGGPKAGRDAEKLLEESVSSLSRIEKVFSSVAENERLFRNILTAHAIADAIAASWFVDPGSPRKMMEARLARIGELADLVPRPERDILAHLLDERRKAVGSASPDLRKIAQARLELLSRLQEEGKALCDVRENALMPDFLLQTLRVVRASGLAPRPTAPWHTCFLSARPFQAVEKFSFDGNAETAMLAFVPRTGPIAANLRAHDAVFGASDPLGALVGAGLGPEGSWHAVAFLSGVSTPVSPFPPKAPWPVATFNEKCGSKSKARSPAPDPSLCAQFAYRLTNSAQERMDILQAVQEDYSPIDLAHAAFGVATDLYTGRLLQPSGAKGSPGDAVFRKLGFAQYFSSTYPEFAALEWHIKNGGP